MRCHYLSDLHLERQEFPWTLPSGDCLIVAGDLCNAVCLDPTRVDRYSLDQRDRVLRFADAARSRFRHVLLVAGNHEHYDGVLDASAGLLRQGLAGLRLLDDEAIEIGGVVFFGTTLWTNFAGRDPAAMGGVRKRMGEYFFVKVREVASDGGEQLRKFTPEDAADAFDVAWAKLTQAVAAAAGRPLVVISHHAPSLQGLNPQHRGNALDAAYGSDLDRQIEQLGGIRTWVHGHTHIRHAYRIGATEVLANCRGFEGKDAAARRFSPAVYFEVC
jgi:3',5'-cyclic AMP phosphodiesterase CpdA